jgi:hypothetical protein
MIAPNQRGGCSSTRRSTDSTRSATRSTRAAISWPASVVIVSSCFRSSVATCSLSVSTFSSNRCSRTSVRSAVASMRGSTDRAALRAARSIRSMLSTRSSAVDLSLGVLVDAGGASCGGTPPVGGIAPGACAAAVSARSSSPSCGSVEIVIQRTLHISCRNQVDVHSQRGDLRLPARKVPRRCAVE